MNDNPDLANCSASEPFALRVIGNDMSPEFEDGHVIIVDPGGLSHDETTRATRVVTGSLRRFDG